MFMWALVAWVVSITCQPWCKHHCHELGGDITTECASCAAETFLCRPGMPGFGDSAVRTLPGFGDSAVRTLPVFGDSAVRPLPKARDNCASHCRHPCIELSGDVTKECSNCAGSEWLCRPGEPGFETHGKNEQSIRVVVDPLDGTTDVDSSIEVKADPEKAHRFSPRLSSPCTCRNDLTPSQLQAKASSSLPLLVGLTSCEDVLRLGLCTEREGCEACATACGLCDKQWRAQRGSCQADLPPAKLYKKSITTLPLLYGLHSCTDVLRLELCTEREAQEACATSCGLCGAQRDEGGALR
mmetsp:Transcript_34236/g.56683  ORF Transcript_34236/g.56683 Transcript_34236/m.56683 type:complete len:298 (+) Transcript_34236:182-1075(+)|eukprot:CAMPEP_0119311240 /NCGR_PEP_ID=MMETSP1333-20130426/21996_1 /TAXON_ID=418940 /ORGANISM="Scyphosphaera apsteinii, Strain RCC1455" /LENGTH=297 /DNA_ID=CAMNT_0007315575 /DNA_START=203 /DNA_END=1096 /DNA_ORIENTATION=-